MKKVYLFLAILLGFHLFLLTKLQFTAWPEMLSFPYMIDKGLLIYKDFHHVYQPLLTFMLAFYYKFSGFSDVSLKVFTWASIILIDLAIFLVSGRLFGEKLSSLIPVAIFIGLQPIFEGNMLWFDLALSVPVLLAIYFVFQWSQRSKLLYIFFTGLFLSTGFLIKQQAALIFLPFLVYILIKKISFKEFLNFALGVALPLAGLLIFLIITGDLKDYFFWTLQFPVYWLPKIPGYKILPMTREWEILLLMSAVPILSILANLKKKENRFDLIFLASVFIFELVSAFPRFSFFHLQPALAVFAIMISYLFLGKNKLVLTLAALIILFIGLYRWKLVIPELNGNTRFYGDDEIHLAQRIDSVTFPGDKIYLLGPNSVGYVLSDRIPPKPWIENYVWHFEIPGMQEKVISGWESDPPKVIFWTRPSPGNRYDLGTYQPKRLTDWIRTNYIRKEETKSGIEVWYLKIQ